MKPYPVYKHSGVDWLGEVPEGWEVVRLKFVVERNDGGIWGDDPTEENNTIVLRSTEQTEDGEWCIEDPAFRNIQSDDAVRYCLEEGDILITKSSGSARHIGKATLVDETIAALNACYSNFMQRIRTGESYLPKLAWYLFNNPLARRQFDLMSSSSTGLANLTAGMIGQIVIPLPPLPEQRAIAGFLDREVGKIDALVAESRRLVALLAEKRQATISHAVTRGLNPAAPLRPSGIDWLGDIPEGWEVVQLKRYAKLQGGYAFSSALFNPDGVPVVRMTNLDRGELDFSSLICVPECAVNERVALREGDLIWGMSGSVGETGSLGNYARVREKDLPCQLNQRVGRFLAQPDRLDLSFLELIIQTRYFYEQILLWVTGTAQYNISSEQVESCSIAVPPISEQAEIVAEVRLVLARFDALTAEANSAIALLLERRAALISAAVTGKIDVRGEAPAEAAAGGG
ncbi:restriction endonuclease subunit S [Paenirhodobacter hankyongi]|uniref:Restriction endonuclease subunit S n=1 Tax=Paenirhodobacter hankyongi TaxID=2294033 RepID=A0A421BXI1_9RHOB|nr:restriction endonuclease subunit S [Sinirhodobacter hankyongi]RLL73043.1 restriction endonuclease subunit S [Sinirhodobacter hankyongi]